MPQIVATETAKARDAAHIVSSLALWALIPAAGFWLVIAALRCRRSGDDCGQR
jgi:hypothetical protein